MHLLALGAF